MRRLLWLSVGALVVACVAVVSSGGATQTAGRWVIRDLGTLGGPGAYAKAINNHGQIVGAADTKARGKIGTTVLPIQHAFLWENGKMRDLGAAFGGPGSRAEAINERGQVVGAADTKTVAKSGHHVTHAFLWESGKMRDLGTLPGKQSSYAVAVNERGQVLGASCDSVGDHCRAFLWQQGTMTDLGALGPHYVFWPLAINDRGQVIGAVDTQAKYAIPGFWSLSGIPQAFLWQNGRVTKLGSLGGAGSWAVAINERGQVVGSADTTKTITEGGWEAGMPVRHAFLWEKGRMRDLGTLGGEASGAVAVNNRGQVIGWSDTKAEVPHVFLWQSGKIRDLEAGYGGGDYGGQPAINERGQIVGSSCRRVATKCRAFLWQNGRLTDLGALNDAFPESTAVAINGHNQILGQVWSPTSHAQHAVLWTLKRG